jgi:VWFA-related protein
MKPLIALVVVLCSTTLSAQVSETIDVRVINVDVTVTSKSGPVRGLTRDDFQVFEDGVARPVTNFYAVEPVVKGASTSPVVADQTLADPTDERFRRKVLVIVDNRHVTMFNRDRTLAALERFVDDRFTGGTYDWSIVLLSSKTRLLLPLTSDKEKLHSAVATIRKVVAHNEQWGPEDPEPVALRSSFGRADLFPRTTVENRLRGDGVGKAGPETLREIGDFGTNLQIEADSRGTIEAIRDAVRSFAGVSGRKIIMLVTGGLGLDSGVSPLDVNPLSFLAGPAAADEQARNATNLRDLLIHEANSSNVSFFIVNSEGLAVHSSSMYWLARETGGRLMNGNSPDLSMAGFDSASSSFYSLGYKPAHGDDGKYHSIKVRIRQRGYQLQYRTGYSSVPVNVQLARAMDSPLAESMQQSSIPINITAGDSAPYDGGVLVPLRAAVAAKDLQFLPSADGSIARVDLYLTVFDDHGRRVFVRRFTSEAHAASGTESRGDFVDTRQILIKRGVPYRVVVAVHDKATDAIGISSKVVRF